MLTRVKARIDETPRTDHPLPEELEAFMACRLGQDGRRRVVRHLLAGCQRCQEVTRCIWDLADEPLDSLPVAWEEGEL